jgi:hypothetical protein
VWEPKVGERVGKHQPCRIDVGERIHDRRKKRKGDSQQRDMWAKREEWGPTRRNIKWQGR